MLRPPPTTGFNKMRPRSTEFDLAFCRTCQSLSNYVELCRTLSNFVGRSNFVELVELCRTLSNFVELCRTCRTLSNYVELCQFGRILKFFVKFSLFLSLSDCQTSQNFVEFFKVIQVYPALTMILAGPNFVWGSSVPPPLHTMYACPIELTSSPLIQ